jgi:hypothetical protein
MTISKKYKLKRFASTNNNLRTKEVVGVILSEPEEGNSLTMISDPLDPEADFRQVTTSRITALEKTPNGWQFRTLNSVYSLTEEQA